MARRLFALPLLLLLAHASTLASAFCPAFPPAVVSTISGKLSVSAPRPALGCGARSAARIAAGRPRQGTLAEGLQMARKDRLDDHGLRLLCRERDFSFLLKDAPFLLRDDDGLVLLLLLYPRCRSEKVLEP